MTSQVLLRHGEHTKPHYEVSPDAEAGWAGRSTDAERPDGKASGIVRRYRKSERVSDTPYSMGLITQKAQDALRYSTPAGVGLRGFSLACGVLALIAAWIMIRVGLLDSYSLPPKTILDPVIWLIAPLPLLGSVAVFIWSVRLELFRPVDEPSVFDRKRRKVYRVFCEAQPGLKGLFRHWPMRACEYEWDLIDVEHNARVVTTGSTVRREHTLIFVVRRSVDDPTIIDSFNIGNSAIMVTDDAVDAAWEHIRRFMEENGPSLPEGEALTSTNVRKDVRRWLSGYFTWWRKDLPLMILGHALFPLTLLWLICRWLANATARPIEWPAEVVAAVGPDVAAQLKP